MIKIVNTEEILELFWKMRNEVFRKDVTYYNIISQKKIGFTLSLEDRFLEKPLCGVKLKPLLTSLKG